MRLERSHFGLPVAVARHAGPELLLSARQFELRRFSLNLTRVRSDA